MAFSQLLSFNTDEIPGLQTRQAIPNPNITQTTQFWKKRLIMYHLDNFTVAADSDNSEPSSWTARYYGIELFQSIEILETDIIGCCAKRVFGSKPYFACSGTPVTNPNFPQGECECWSGTLVVPRLARIVYTENYADVDISNGIDTFKFGDLLNTGNIGYQMIVLEYTNWRNFYQSYCENDPNGTFCQSILDAIAESYHPNPPPPYQAYIIRGFDAHFVPGDSGDGTGGEEDEAQPCGLLTNQDLVWPFDQQFTDPRLILQEKWLKTHF